MHPSAIALKKTVAPLILLVAVLMLTPACRSQPAEQRPPDEIAVQLKWVHQAQFAGFYVAQENGYYAQENLEVTLLEGGPDVDIVDQVLDGPADFGVFAPENLIIERSQGQPVVAVAVIFRRNPLVFVSLAGSGIKRPQDFLGRSAALAPEAHLQLQALLKRLNLDVNQVTIEPYKYDHSPLYEGKADITYGYSTGGLIRMYQTGRDFNLIWPSDYGVHLYADTLFTTDQMVAENPELVTRFLRATLRGWREAIGNSDEAVATTMKYAREADADLQTQMMAAVLPLVHTGEDQIGWMRPQVWQGMHNILLEQNLLAEPIELSQVYTMQFLEAVYGSDAP